jgi:hypothetical protein
MAVNDVYLARIREKCALLNDQKIACEAFIRELPGAEQERLAKLVAETTYHRRKYGQCDFYCWPIHPVFSDRPTDPWPASRFPKFVLMSEFAIRTQPPPNGGQ